MIFSYHDLLYLQLSAQTIEKGCCSPFLRFCNSPIVFEMVVGDGFDARAKPEASRSKATATIRQESTPVGRANGKHSVGKIKKAVKTKF